MPKKTFSVDDFSGGANTFESPQNVAPNELVKSQGFYIIPGEVGVIGDMKGTYTGDSGGSNAANDGETAAANITIESGYGLFSFSHDYQADGGLGDTKYMVIMDGVTFDVWADSDTPIWVESAFNLGTVASDTSFAGSVKPCFFIADGALRVSPGNFAAKDSIGGMSADFTATSVYGEHEDVAADSDLTNYVSVGDTVVINGQEMVALIVAATKLTAARNMTGTFPSITANATADAVNVVLDTRWRGVVNRRNFSQAGAVGTFTEWYSTYSHPRPPVTYEDDISQTTSTSSVDAGDVSPQYTFPFLVNLTSTTAIVDGSRPPTMQFAYLSSEDHDDATWAGATIHLYCTALYDEVKQESQPNKITRVANPITVATGKELGMYVNVNYADASISSGFGATDGTYMINKRVTGARLYYEDTLADPGILYQLLEIDFEKGVKKAESEAFTPWNQEIADEVVESHAGGEVAAQRTTTNGAAFIFVNPPKAFTYEINTGYPSDVNTHARYKTAVILNRRLFVGNVYQSGKANGDRMIGSPVNKFDILPETNTIDVTVGDGDQIVKLEGFADRILQFKKSALYIINIGGGQGGEFLESQHKNMGVQNPSQTCLTEYGVAWVNSKGVYLFDGKQVTDLTRNKLKLSSSTRGEALNVDEDNIPIIGFHPTNKWLVIHPESTVADANDVEAWILDFKSGAWTYTNTFTTTNDYKTNMVWTGDDELVLAAGTNSSNTPDFFKYQDGTSCDDAGFGATTKLELLTKEFDLELPGVRKMLHSVHVTYSAAANSSIEADIIYKDSSGQTTVALEEENSGSTYYTEALGFKSTSSAIRTARLTPASRIRKAYTFQLKLHNPDVAYAEGADFKLYNISFNYRMLGAK